MPFSSVTAARKKVKALKGLSTKQVKKFNAVVNALLASGEDESSAIAQGISTAKKIEKASKEETMSKLTPIIKAVDDELMQSVDIAYVPYELDAQKQWMRPETIRKGCENFNVNLEKGNIKPNLYHKKDKSGAIEITETFEIMKSWINEVECQIGDEIVPEGTWLCKLQYLNKSSWELRKAGVLCGISMGALGTTKKPTTEET